MSSLRGEVQSSVLNLNTPQTVRIMWRGVEELIQKVRENLDKYHYVPDVIIGVANGGIIPAQLLAHTYTEKIPLTHIGSLLERDDTFDLTAGQGIFKFYKSVNYLIVDDIFDSGRTYNTIQHQLPEDVKLNIFWAFLYRRTEHNKTLKEIGSVNFPQRAVYGKLIPKPDYIIFPWEYNVQKDIVRYFSANIFNEEMTKKPSDRQVP